VDEISEIFELNYFSPAIFGKDEDVRHLST
jgi:hypothetical protein